MYLFAGLRSVPCDPGWTLSHHTGGCYKFFSSPKSWSAALRSCQEHGGDLASISDQATNDFIKSLGGNNPQEAFIGTRRPFRTWTDGTPWCYEKWNKGEPNNASGKEDFGTTVVGRRRDGSECSMNSGMRMCGTWNDHGHATTPWDQGVVGYVCQK